jgi:hypothetical protein
MKIKFNKVRITSFTIKVVTWLCVTFKLDFTRPVKDFLGLLQVLENIEINSGQVRLTKYVKNARLALARYLSGQPFKKIDGVRLTKDGIPVILGPWIPSLRSGHISSSDVKMIMTILTMTRALNLGKDVDLDPILSPSSYELPADIEDKIFLFWKELGFRRSSPNVPSRAQFTQFHQTTKVSPSKISSKKNALYHSLG